MADSGNNAGVRLIAPRPEQLGKPLFVFLPGMDGAGTLLQPQLDVLAPHFDVRCLSIPPTDDAGWNRLTHQVVRLIREELTRAIRKVSASQLNLPSAQPSSGPRKDLTKSSLTGRRRGRRKGLMQKDDGVDAISKPARRSVYLCGESFGGCLAMHVLTQAPDLFDRVVLVNPASSFRRLPWMQLGQMITQQLPSTLYRYSALGLVPFLINPFRVGPHERKSLEQAMGAVPPKTAAWRMSLLSGFELERLPLERMAHPVLLVAGGRDRLLPSKREVQSLCGRFPNAQQHLLPNSGHACLLENGVNLQKIMQQYGFTGAR
ncbi:MAG: alpha/beta fold hydrolase [Phormidesmis sp.]